MIYKYDSLESTNKTAKEMAGGLVLISRNIQLITGEVSAIRQSADSTEASSEELLKIANDLDDIISKFKTS